VISEIEFAAPFKKAVTIGITGSNGKDNNDVNLSLA
jgi:UDP-N-acetylmuramoylalanine-D-glutamate ligase